MSFGEDYQKILNIVKSDIEKIEQELASCSGLSSQTDSALKLFLTKKSKRIRPLTAFLYLRARGFEPDFRQYTLQSVVEIIHNASLLHDDVIDESGIRRGQLTINNKFNNKIAILSGDYLLALALEKLNSLSSPQIITLCSSSVCQMCRGEVFQQFMKGKIPTIEQYLKKTEQKTAGLFKLAIEGAMILAGATNLTEASEFALNFGILFQIRDDLLNIIDSAQLKPSQNDLLCGIYNAPVIFSGNTTDLTKGIEKTKDLLNNYVIKAADCINELENSKYKSALRELLEILNNVQN